MLRWTFEGNPPLPLRWCRAYDERQFEEYTSSDQMDFVVPGTNISTVLVLKWHATQTLFNCYEVLKLWVGRIHENMNSNFILHGSLYSVSHLIRITELPVFCSEQNWESAEGYSR